MHSRCSLAGRRKVRCAWKNPRPPTTVTCRKTWTSAFASWANGSSWAATKPGDRFASCSPVVQETTMQPKPPLPPFTAETALQKVRLAEDAWNTRDPDRVVQVYTEDTQWRNRAEFPV